MKTDMMSHNKLLLLGALAVTTGCYSGYRGTRVDTTGLGGGDTDGVNAEDTDGSGGGNDSGGDDGEDPPTAEINCTQETAWSVSFLEDNCGGCHGSGTEGKGGFDYVTDLGRLVESGKIVPGQSNASPLLSRLEQGSMPPAEVTNRPGDAQIARFADFIDSCASEPAGQCQDNDPVDTYQTLDLIATDVIGVDFDDREFIRYLTLTHLHNAGYCDDELDVLRQAMSKMLNGLSTDVKITAPEPIDAAETIYRIDLRDYGWDEPVNGFNNKWEAIAAASPYSVRRLEDQAEFVQDFTGSDIPILMADAVVDVAMQPPLYYDLAGVPNSLGGLQALLNVDIDDNINDQDAQRAGVQDSGISRNNRVVERHELATGFGQTLWLAYDFINDADPGQNIFTSPLDLDPSLIEAIYSLPNGSHAYALFDQNGQRVNTGIDEIAGDPLQDDGDLRAGISCVGCHTSILEAEDIVRDHVLGSFEFDPQTKDDIATLYPPVYEFTALQEDATTAYHGALAQAGVETGSPVEPVSVVFQQHRANVDLKTAAAELGVSETTLLTNLGRLSPVLIPLANGPVKRDTWEARFPETICLLNLGETDDPACDGVDGEPDGADGGDDPADEVDIYGDCANNAASICGFNGVCLEGQDFAVCSPVPCQADADCPDGPAPVECRESSVSNGFQTCVIDCSQGQACPAGMTCRNGDICAFDQL